MILAEFSLHNKPVSLLAQYNEQQLVRREAYLWVSNPPRWFFGGGIKEAASFDAAIAH